MALKFCPQLDSVLEACCGNGRLLVALKDHARQLSGFDFARSRVSFAKDWIEGLGLENVEIWRDDLLQPSQKLQKGRADLLVCLSGTFGYFEAYEEGAEESVAQLFGSLVRPGGALLLELYPHPDILRDCMSKADYTSRDWKELDESDAFRFYLSEYSYDPSRKVLTHKKTFIRKDGFIDDGRMEKLRIYDEGELIEKFSQWFLEIDFYKNWEGDRYAEGDALMILFASGRKEA